MSSKLVPPHLRFANLSEVLPENGLAVGERSSHSRTHSSKSLSNGGAEPSPPITPRNMGFGTPMSPLSPPGSISSFTPAHTPSGSLTVPPNQSPFPDFSNAGLNSRASSHGELPRKSSFGTGSRPNTGDYTRPSSVRLREAFASPKPRPLTLYSTVQNSTVKIQRERPKSTMWTPEKTSEKPWLSKRDPYNRIAYFLTYGVMFLGIAAGAVRCFLGWRGVHVLKGNLCPVMDEHFNSEEGMFGENGKFFREVDMSGFGNGEFEMTTDSPTNSYVRNGYLYITPTLTSDVIGEAAIEDGHIFNITDCTFNITRGVSYTDENKSTTGHGPNNISAIGVDQEFDAAGYQKACSAVSNATSGAIINPIQSARLSTRLSASIRFGRVEVRAKIPTGDWLWPAIWMLPVDNVYGGWPMSGEIDIMEARGNGPRYPNQGSNYVRGSLNWGPDHSLNRAFKTYGWWEMRRGSYDKDFHTYAVEWDEEFIRIYVDNRLHHLLDLRIKKSFWELGEFPPGVQQGAETVALHNIWANGTKVAPFDQKFYLILDVGVGGTNGWFPDGKEKPWYDGAETAMGQFWRARHDWLPTWPQDPEERSMVVDYVKMWQKC